MSESKKLVYELSIEDLVDLATKEPVIVPNKATEASKFIYESGIKHGDTRVSAALVFHTYKIWKATNYHEKFQSKAQFFRDFSKHFQSVRLSDGKYYLLNSEPFDHSKETYFIIRAEQRREKSRKRKKA
jgi:hypothetical protein